MRFRIASILMAFLSAMVHICSWSAAQEWTPYNYEGEWKFFESTLSFGAPDLDAEVFKSRSYSDEWEFAFTPYANLPAVNYDATVAGSTVNIDMSLSDLLDNFDVLAFSGHFEAWKGNWGILFDGAYTSLDSDFEKAFFKINVDIVDTPIDLSAGYRIEPIRLSVDNNFPTLVFDFKGGARYHYLRQKINLNPGPRVGESYDWVEPVVGGRGRFYFNEKAHVIVMSDVSGFGIGSASDITWSAMAGFGYNVSNWFALKAGYYYSYIDYSRGSGLNEFGLEGYQHGPALGATFKF